MHKENSLLTKYLLNILTFISFVQFHRISDMQQIYTGFMKTTRTSHSFKRTITELPIFPRAPTISKVHATLLRL